MFGSGQQAIIKNRRAAEPQNNEPQNNEPQNIEGMYSGNFIKNRATCPLVPQAASPFLAGGRACNGRRERFHTSIFDIHVIDIRYSQFSTDYFAIDDNFNTTFLVLTSRRPVRPLYSAWQEGELVRVGLEAEHPWHIHP